MMRGMNDMAQLVKECRRLGGVETEALAQRWLRATVSVLADWGGEAAARALASGVPGGLFSGGGTRGLSLAKAQDRVPGTSAGIALLAEIGRRVGQEDPGKIAQMATPALGLVKGCLAPDPLNALLAALPGDVAAELRDASVAAPWGFGLIPQSYARPPRKRAH
jgi:hypothetical protein